MNYVPIYKSNIKKKTICYNGHEYDQFFHAGPLYNCSLIEKLYRCDLIFRVPNKSTLSVHNIRYVRVYTLFPRGTPKFFISLRRPSTTPIESPSTIPIIQNTDFTIHSKWPLNEPCLPIIKLTYTCINILNLSRFTLLSQKYVLF